MNDTTELTAQEVQTPQRVYVGGVPVDALDASELTQRLIDEVENPQPSAINVGSVNLMYLGYFGIDGSHEAFFADSESRGRRWLMTIDGNPVATAASKVLGRRIEKIPGSDYLPHLMDVASERGWRVGVFGGAEAANGAFVEKARSVWPGAYVTYWSPERAEILNDSERLCAEIKNEDIDLLIIALPKPLAEEWMDRWVDACGAKVLLALGASVDFQVGAQHRAPKIVRKVKAEWLWRLAKDPKRMWNRYVVEGPGEWWRSRRFSGLEPGVATPDLWRRRIARRLLAIDVVAAVIATLGALVLRQVIHVAWFKAYSPNALDAVVAIPMMVSGIGAVKGRRVDGVRIDGAKLLRFLTGVGTGVAGVGLVSFIFHQDISRGYVALMGIFALLVGGVARIGYSWRLEKSRKRGRNLVRVLGVGDQESMAALLAWFVTHPNTGYKVVGTMPSLPDALPYPVGMVAVGGVTSKETARADELIRGRGEVMVVADLVSVDARRLVAETFADQSVLHITPVEIGAIRAAIKRSLDVVLSLLVLVLSSPLLGLLAWKIKREDGGPVLFKQVRVGLDGCEFEVLKLRTMVVDAEAKLAELAAKNEAGPYLFKLKDDPRITKVGKLLRKTSLDELPQLWNVVRGDMSLVGPRPALPSEVAMFPPEGHRRHRVRPGVTGLWQVSGRSDLDSMQALALDLHYVANWSLVGDLTILLRTIRTVLRREGAR